LKKNRQHNGQRKKYTCTWCNFVWSSLTSVLKQAHFNSIILVDLQNLWIIKNELIMTYITGLFSYLDEGNSCTPFIRNMINTLRRVWRYQRGNHNPYIEEEQTTQWSKEKVQKDKQRSIFQLGSCYSIFIFLRCAL
jgi:hypothetical protein